MATHFRQHILKDNERTRLKSQQPTQAETQRPVGTGSNDNWMLERDRLLAIIQEGKENLLKRQQAEKERLEKEELEKACQKERLRKIALEAARLARWKQWVHKIRENLSGEGFTLSDGIWSKPINPDDIDNTITFEDAKTKKLSDIPFGFANGLEDSAYIYVGWDRIRYEYIWYSQREENLLDLGFEQSEQIGYWSFKPWISHLTSHWRSFGFFSSRSSNFLETQWTWPGAQYDEHFYYTSRPEDFSPYQILDLADFDKTLLDGSRGRCYRKNPACLPSARLALVKDPLVQWMRGFANVEMHHQSEEKVHLRVTAALWEFESSKVFTVWSKLSSSSTSSIPKDINPENTKPKNKEGVYDYDHSKKLLEQMERFWRLCLRGCSWLDNVLPYRWSRRAARYSWDWVPPPRSSQQYTYKVSGLLNEQPSSAFPDTGSDQNLLSRDYATRNDIAIFPDANGTKHIKSADGRLIPTTGIAELSWSFEDSPHEKHMLVFHVLEQCVHDVLLGHPFLVETNTTTLNRIKRYTVNATSSNSAGAIYDIHAASGLQPGQCSIDGHLEGEAIRTLADTGAQVNIMSLAYAQSKNFKLDISGNRGTFRFIDGSEAPSIATVNAVWTSNDKKQYSLKFEVLIGSSYDVILGQKHIYGTKALLGRKSDPSASPSSSHATTPMTLDPLPAEPRRAPPPSRNLEPPDASSSKASNVCAVGFKPPFAKASKAVKSLLSKTKKKENTCPHLSSQAQEEIDRRATKESRQFQVTRSDSPPPSDTRDISRNSSDRAAVASTSNGSASTESIAISTTIEPEVMPASDTAVDEVLTPEEYQVENAYPSYLSNLLVYPITLCNYVCDSAAVYMSSQSRRFLARLVIVIYGAAESLLGGLGVELSI